MISMHNFNMKAIFYAMFNLLKPTFRTTPATKPRITWRIWDDVKVKSVTCLVSDFMPE